MKIAILSFYSGFNNRGTETWVDELKHNLPGKFEVEVISGVVGESVIGNAIRTCKKWVNTDIIIPTNGRFQTLFCRIVTLIVNKPLIIFGHSGLGADDKWNLLCSPNVFVAFSDYQKNWAEKYKLPWTKVVKIFHAVDIHKFTPSIKTIKNNVVLCVAANRPLKRIDLVKHAVDLLPGVNFIAVGNGNQMEVKFDKMPDVYRNANVFCFVPQPWEAFGLVFLEAMASNLPVVTTNDPIRREIVGDAGILVDNPENSQELANAINKALKTNWGNKPRQQAEKFSWEKTIEKYEELFQEVAL